MAGQGIRNRRVTIGRRYLFIYPDFGSPDSYPKYTAHSGQAVKVLRQLTEKECDAESQPMYEVQAKDGWKGHVHGGELHALNLLGPKGVYASREDRAVAKDAGITVHQLRLDRATDDLY